MAGHGRHFREDFDRSRNFIVIKPIKVSGEVLGSGDPLDKTLFSDRRLRQLYDMRFVGYPEQSPGMVKTSTNGHQQQQPEKTVVVVPSKPKVTRYRPNLSKRHGRRRMAAQ